MIPKWRQSLSEPTGAQDFVLMAQSNHTNDTKACLDFTLAAIIQNWNSLSEECEQMAKHFVWHRIRVMKTIVGISKSTDGLDLFYARIVCATHLSVELLWLATDWGLSSAATSQWLLSESSVTTQWALLSLLSSPSNHSVTLAMNERRAERTDRRGLRAGMEWSLIYWITLQLLIS